MLKYLAVETRKPHPLRHAACLASLGTTVTIVYAISGLVALTLGMLLAQ